MILDQGDGSTGSGGDGAYRKPAGLSSHKGAVYAVAGSSSKLSSGSLNHPAMVVSLYRLGSMVIDIDANALVARFLDDNGSIRDDFTIQKDGTVDVAGEPRAPGTSGALQLTAHPNPFSSAGARLDYVLPSAGRATLTIYRVDGTRVARLVDEDLPAGSQSFSWSAHDAQGNPINPGVHFAALEYRGDARVRRLVKVQ